MKHARKVLWGMAFLTIGILLALNALEILPGATLFDGWWTLFLIVPCLIGLLTDQDKAWPGAGLLTGVVLLLICRNVLTGSLLLKLLLPVLIILLGICMMFRTSTKKKYSEALRRSYMAGKSLEEVCAVFQRQKATCTEDTFQGIDATAVFGKLTMNLMDKTIADQTVIRANCVLGSVEVLLPAKVNVVTGYTGFLGRLTTSALRSNEEGQPTVYIYGNCSLGRIHIK